MKEILFRGKTLPKENQDFEFNNVWVYGDLIIDKTTGKYYIHPQNNTFKTENEIAKTMVVHEVVPNTIGQYIGITDKNGERIFEDDLFVTRNGDVVSMTYYDANHGVFLPFGNNKYSLNPKSVEVAGNYIDNREIMVDNAMLHKINNLVDFLTSDKKEDITNEQLILPVRLGD